MGLEEEIADARALAAGYAEAREELVGVVPAEPAGIRIYLCAYQRDGVETWLAIDGEGTPVAERALVRDAVSIAALCELAEESAGGGDLAQLRASLAQLRETEAPEGIEAAEDAARELEETILPPPRLASIEYLDTIGRAAGTLEEALGESVSSPFAAAMKNGLAAAEELSARVEGSYKVPLSG
jgi:hypothetical protein